MEIERIYNTLLHCWDEKTSFTPESCYPATSTMGQSLGTTLLIQKLLGGQVMCADLFLPRDNTMSFHYWNRVDRYGDIDFIRSSYGPGVSLLNIRPIQIVMPGQSTQSGIEPTLLADSQKASVDLLQQRFAMFHTFGIEPVIKFSRCCPLDSDADGNCYIHSAPGVLRHSQHN
jgi:hypothetical protein